MPRTEEEMMDMRGSEVVSYQEAAQIAAKAFGDASTLGAEMQACGLPLHEVAAMQLKGGIHPAAVSEMLHKNGWPTPKIHALLRAHGVATGHPLSSSGAGGGGIKGMQRELAGIGMPVRVTGKVDAATVDAVNAVFHGWDDAPPLLKNGDLSARQISANLPFVEKYVRKAIGGAQEFGDATRDG